jgi:hypothetical protein
MAAITLLLSVLSLFITSVLANTEKTIFLGPDPISVTGAHSTLSNLPLDTLTPSNGALRTKLSAQFPTAEDPEGSATWLVLDKLNPNQRYEVRVCWPATVRLTHSPSLRISCLTHVPATNRILPLHLPPLHSVG